MKTPSHEIDNSDLIRELAEFGNVRQLSDLLQRAREALHQVQPDPDEPPATRTYKSNCVTESVLLEASAGVMVGTFFEEVVEMRKDYGEYDTVVAVFNDRYLTVTRNTTVDDLLRAYV